MGRGHNVWIVGNDEECVIIDSPHDAAAIPTLGATARDLTPMRQVVMGIVPAAERLTHLLVGLASGEVSAERVGERGHRPLAEDLRSAFPDMKGLSAQNLRYMTAPEPMCHTVANLPWGHIRTILDTAASAEERDWCDAPAVQ